MNRPSDGFTEAELRDEVDWMFEFNARMAEHIRGDADAHSLAGYVCSLEDENARLRSCLSDDEENARFLVGEIADLRRLAKNLWACLQHRQCDNCEFRDDACDFKYDLKALGIEVDA